MYDSYVLALSWTAEFCKTKSSNPECSQLSGDSYAASNLALHGLWPQYNKPQGTQAWPQFCGKDNATFWQYAGALSTGISNQFSAQWKEYAPGYAYGTLAEHEWPKHGSCYSSMMRDAQPDDIARLQSNYFGYQMDLLQSNNTPKALMAAQSSGQPIAVSDLQNAFGGPDQVALGCNVVKGGQAYLSQVSLCFTPDATTGKPSKRQACPDDVLSSSYDNGCVTNSVGKIYVAQWGDTKGAGDGHHNSTARL